MKKHIIYTILSGFILTAVSCSNNNEELNTVPRSTPIEVTTASVEEIPQAHLYTSSGKIQSTKQANLSTRIMGNIKHIHVTVGSQVSQGQLLLQLNNNDLNAKLAQVNANITSVTAVFSNAQKDYERFVELHKAGSASLKELEDISAHYKISKANLEGVKEMKQEIIAQLEYTNIRAPFSGIISSKYINEGDLANPGMPLLSIENNTAFEVKTMVSETEISKINMEMPVHVTVKSNDKSLQGTVKEISTSAQHSGTQFEVIIQLEKHSDLYSGMYAKVEFPIAYSKSNKNIMIPTSALVEYGQLQGVYIVSQQNTAILRWLRLGNRIGHSIEVLSGLNPNDKYIVSAKGKLENGSALTITK